MLTSELAFLQEVAVRLDARSLVVWVEDEGNSLKGSHVCGGRRIKSCFMSGARTAVSQEAVFM